MLRHRPAPVAAVQQLLLASALTCCCMMSPVSAAPNSTAAFWRVPETGMPDLTASSATYCGDYLVVGHSATRHMKVYNQTNLGWQHTATYSASAAHDFASEVRCISSSCSSTANAKVAVRTGYSINMYDISHASGKTSVSGRQIRVDAAPPGALGVQHGEWAQGYVDGTVFWERFTGSAACTAGSTTSANGATIYANASHLSLTPLRLGLQDAEGSPAAFYRPGGGTPFGTSPNACSSIAHYAGAGLRCVDGGVEWAVCTVGKALYAASASSTGTLQVRYVQHSSGPHWGTGTTVTMNASQFAAHRYATRQDYSRSGSPHVECSAAHGAVVAYRGEVLRAFVPRQHGGYTGYGAWGTCSATCGNGTQTRRRNCSAPYPKYGGASCSRLGSATETQSCVHYRTEWVVKSTAECQCDNTQARVVVCRRCDGVEVAHSLCTGTKPATSVSCVPSLFEWVTGLFGECSTTVSKQCMRNGQKTRTVTCRNACTKVTAADNKCTMRDRPQRTQFCTGMWYQWVPTQVCIRTSTRIPPACVKPPTPVGPLTARDAATLINNPCIVTASDCAGVKALACETCFGVQEDDAQCAGVTKPRIACTAELFQVAYGSFGYCVEECGVGVQEREGGCIDRCEEGRGDIGDTNHEPLWPDRRCPLPHNALRILQRWELLG